jgi:hypothetical protein
MERFLTVKIHILVVIPHMVLQGITTGGNWVKKYTGSLCVVFCNCIESIIISR